MLLFWLVNVVDLASCSVPVQRDVALFSTTPSVNKDNNLTKLTTTKNTNNTDNNTDNDNDNNNNNNDHNSAA